MDSKPEMWHLCSMLKSTFEDFANRFPATVLDEAKARQSDKQADIAEKFLLKGSEVVIEGKLINRNYTDKEGIKKYVTEVQVNEMLLLGLHMVSYIECICSQHVGECH